MTDFLLILGLTLLSNVFVTLFIFHKYTLNLTEEICKMMDNNLSAMKVTTDVTFDVRRQVFKELEKFRKDNDKNNQL